MVKKSYVPERGDFAWISFNPTKGREQSGFRPALVLTSSLYNTKSDLVLACPITSRTKGYPFEVYCRGNKIDGVILSDQIKSIDWTKRKMQFIEKASPAVMNEVTEKIKILIA